MTLMQSQVLHQCHTAFPIPCRKSPPPAYVPAIVPEMLVPFFSSMVTDSLLSFIKNLPSHQQQPHKYGLSLSPSPGVASSLTACLRNDSPATLSRHLWRMPWICHVPDELHDYCRWRAKASSQQASLPPSRSQTPSALAFVSSRSSWQYSVTMNSSDPLKSNGWASRLAVHHQLVWTSERKDHRSFRSQTSVHRLSRTQNHLYDVVNALIVSPRYEHLSTLSGSCRANLHRFSSQSVEKGAVSANLIDIELRLGD